MAWNYLKQKPVPTPDANKNNKPVKVSGDKKRYKLRYRNSCCSTPKTRNLDIICGLD